VALAVPSAVLAASTNWIINPNHPGAARIEVVDRQPFRFDGRLRPAG
jgi:RES domain-containing protein